MSKLTNKTLLEQKNKRYTIFYFENNGRRAFCSGNINMVDLTEKVLLATQNNNDILVIEFNEEKDIKIITELEGNQLHRRATRNEIMNFVNNDYK